MGSVTRPITNGLGLTQGKNPQMEQANNQAMLMNAQAQAAPALAQSIMRLGMQDASGQVNRNIASQRGVTPEQAASMQKGVGSNMMQQAGQGALNQGLFQQASLLSGAGALMGSLSDQQAKTNQAQSGLLNNLIPKKK
jgi:hypothetical protein